MLTGRETLIRLIGKCRRFLPNYESLLSTTNTTQSSLNLFGEEDGRIFLDDIALDEESLDYKVDDCESSGHEVRQNDNGNGNGYENGDPYSSDWVTCPVCSGKIRGDDYAINSHLDACLYKGNKRKLTQCTLLQLNFNKKQKVETSMNDPSRLSSVNSLPSQVFVHKGQRESGVQNACHNSISAPDHKKDNSSGTENPTNNNKIEHDVVPGINSSDVYDKTLETYIVGRRYSDQKEINPGAAVSFMRDPHNVKDSNAIKVLHAESGSYETLGFLPRELAQYLSPLLDSNFLRFEGSVVSLPIHPMGAVPIQVVCCKTSSGEMEHLDDDLFRCLWENALQVVESSPTIPLPSCKYVQNFQILLEEVLRTNGHLFSEDEKKFMESFGLLSEYSQRLFLRLYMRKGPWFQVSSISYPDVQDTQQAVKELSEIGYFFSTNDTKQLCQSDLKDILNTLKVAELREIFCIIKKSCSLCKRKQELITTLLSLHPESQSQLLSTVVLDWAGSCIRISSKAESLMWRAERLFFLNGEQDLTAFLLVDLGKVKYPIYNCIITKPIFPNRAELLAYEEAMEVAQLTNESLDGNKTNSFLRCIKIADSHLSTSSLPVQSSALNVLSAPGIYSQVVVLGVSFLEQARRYKDAIHLIKRLLECFGNDGRRGYWTLRLSIDLEHLGCPNESLLVAENGLLDPWVRAGSRMALQRRVLRLGKPPRRWKIPGFSKSLKRQITEVHIQGRPLNCEIGAKSRFYNDAGEQCSVEQLALEYYAREGGWQGIHSESGIWLTIFALLMWDVIFADMPDVFRTRFQNAPLDFGTESFYTMRKNSIEPHLQDIHNGMAEEILIKSWEIHNGTACRGVTWNRHSLGELRAAVTCVGGPSLSELCRHLAQDYHSWSSGMPDLLLWRFHGDFRGEAKLVEVKGPRDRLSEQQRAWLLLLMDCGFAAEVCKVTPLPVDSKHPGNMSFQELDVVAAHCSAIA